MSDIRTLYESLIHLSAPINEIQKEINKLQALSKDSTALEPPVILTRKDVIWAFEQYLNKKISLEQLSRWAVDVNYDSSIDKEPGYRYPIRDVLEDLDMEYGFGEPIPLELIHEWIDRIKNEPFDPKDVD